MQFPLSRRAEKVGLSLMKPVFLAWLCLSATTRLGLPNVLPCYRATVPPLRLSVACFVVDSTRRRIGFRQSDGSSSRRYLEPFSFRILLQTRFQYRLRADPAPSPIAIAIRRGPSGDRAPTCAYT